MTDVIVPAIMVGGSGTRLWPLSRSDRPKQFLALHNEMSMFQNTVLRVKSGEFSRPWFMTNDSYVSQIEAQLPGTGVVPAGIILEPIQRGTAAAIAAMIVAISSKSPDALILVMPADHVVADAKQFREAVARATPLAKFGKIVTFGIVPTAPETGFGYIRRGESIVSGDTLIGYSVEQPGGFLEKPDAVKAQKFVEAGYFWNAGIFLFKASTMLHEFEKHAPETLRAASAAVANGETRTHLGVSRHHLCESSFALAPPSKPVDTEIMEKSHLVAVVPCEDIGWFDVGSLSALWEMSEKDTDNNAVIGNGIAHQSNDLLIYSKTGRKVVGSHLDGMMIVDTPDALIVIPKNKAQAVKEVFELMQKSNAPEVATTTSYCAHWGEVTVASRELHCLVATVKLNVAGVFERSAITAFSETWVALDDGIEYVQAGKKTALLRGQSVKVDRGQSIDFKSPGKLASLVVVCATSDGPVTLDALFAETQQQQNETQQVA
jgi:mannose-1-phosphate guanylyltransferase/mannose-6-phosphate isomerase